MASDKRARLIVALEDLASGKVKSLVDVYAGLKLVVESVNQTFGRLKDFVVDSVKAYAESEQAIIRQNNALRNQGFYSDEYSKALQQNAKDLSKVSTQSDETIMDTQTLLTTFGLAGDQLTRTTQAALDLSAGLGIDLRTATLMLGKAWAGETTTLARYGLKVDETKSSMEKFAQLQDQVTERFGGRSAADAQSYAGKITRLTEAFGNLKEKIGEDFAKASESSVTSLTRLLDVVEKNYEAIKKFSTVTSDVDSFKDVVMGLGAKAGIAMLGMAERVGMTTTRYSELLAMMLKIKEAADAKGPKGADAPTSKPPPPDAKPESDDFTRTANHGDAIAARLAMDEQEAIERRAIMADVDLAAMANMGLMSEAKATLKAQEMAAELQALGQHEEAKALLARQGAANEEAIARVRVQAGMNALSNLASLQHSKNKEMAAVGKAAAISQATIQTYLGATAAYASLAPIPIVGPALGAAAAGAAIVAGMANVATISGVPLAEGGMLMHRTGGVPAIMAEAGHDEVAIPLDDERTQERLRGVMGGGDRIEHHWHIGTLVADDGGLMDLAHKIDEKLFSMERRNMRVSR